MVGNNEYDILVDRRSRIVLLTAAGLILTKHVATMMVAT